MLAPSQGRYAIRFLIRARNCHNLFKNQSCGCPVTECPSTPWRDLIVTDGQFLNDADSGSCVNGIPFKARLNFKYRFCNGVLELCSSIEGFALADGWLHCTTTGICLSDYRVNLSYALEVMRRRGLLTVSNCPAYQSVKWYVCTKCLPAGEVCTISSSRCYMWINVCNEGYSQCSACSPYLFTGANARLKFELVGVYSTEACQPPGSGCTPGCQLVYDFMKCFDSLPNP